MGIKQCRVFFSNSIEVLFEHLKVNLFPEEGNPFSEKILICPSIAMQRWLQLKFVSSFSISCGFEFSFLNQGINKVVDKLFNRQKNFFVPQHLELFLRLNTEIDCILQTKNPHPLWQPLLSYIQGKEERKVTLALHLTELFERYGIYANSASIAWEKQPSNWQEALWSKIFNDWAYPQRVLLNLHAKDEPIDLSIHLFAFSHVSPLHFQFFCEASRKIPVCFYQLSPCQEFWSDLGFEEDSLLASMGKLGRQMAKLIEEKDVMTEDSYIVFGKDTQLKRIQRDLLTLQHTHEIVHDDSIQIHVCMTEHQEIETLYRLLMHFFSTSQLEPQDVIVMAPQISIYTPYIQAIFGKGIDYQITDVASIEGNLLIQGLFLILDLENKRWSAPALLELFGHTLFQKKQGWTEADILLIRAWVQKTGIRWGVNSAHRLQLLQKAHCEKSVLDSTGTWIGGLEHLVEELCLSHDPERITLSAAELLGDVLTLIQTLYLELRTLDMQHTLEDWAIFLKGIVDRYFVATEETHSIIIFFERIKKAGNYFSEKLYAFSVIYPLLKEYLAKDMDVINRNHVQAVTFGSLLPMRAIPAKVICLLGMNHETFPRKEELQALDLLKQNPKSDYFPTPLDFDRYLFLEALLSAREKIIISYKGSDPVDQTELPPSSVILELMAHISKTHIVRHQGYDLAHVRICLPQDCFIKPEKPCLPQGEYIIDARDLRVLCRSSLRHYLKFNDLKITDEDPILADEAFTLDPLKRAMLRKTALIEGHSAAFERAEKDGLFPLGIMGKLARLQLHEEIASLPKKQLHAVHLSPLSLSINPTLTVFFVGTIEGVFDEGLCVANTCSFKNAIKAWSDFLLIQFFDTKKSNLHFPSNTIKTCFFEDPKMHLQRLVAYYFLAKEQPIFLALDWIEPILKKDLKKLQQASIYDATLLWQLRGRKIGNWEQLIEAYHPLVSNLYQELADGWF